MSGEKVLSVTDCPPEYEIICRSLGSWREEPEEELGFISDGNVYNVETHADLSGLIRFVAYREESGPRRADVPVYFRNAGSINVEF